MRNNRGVLSEDSTVAVEWLLTQRRLTAIQTVLDDALLHYYAAMSGASAESAAGWALVVEALEKSYREQSASLVRWSAHLQGGDVGCRAVMKN
jgi:hypothetical protein